MLTKVVEADFWTSLDWVLDCDTLLVVQPPAMLSDKQSNPHSSGRKNPSLKIGARVLEVVNLPTSNGALPSDGDGDGDGWLTKFSIARLTSITAELIGPSDPLVW